MKNLETAAENKGVRKKSSFLRYIHNFRGIAILLIFWSHVISNVPFQEGSFIVQTLNILLRNGTVAFVFIAGFLFQHLSGKYKYKKYLATKARNVILPYLIISIPAILLCLRNQKPYTEVWFADLFQDFSRLKQVIYLYSTGAHLFTLWFIPMITIFFIISPVLLWVDRKPGAYLCLVPLITLSLFVGRPDDYDILESFTHFLSVYIFGMFCSRHQEWLIPKCGKYLPALCLASIFLFAFEIYQNSGLIESDLSHLSVNTLNKMILCLIILFLLWRFDPVLPTSAHSVLGTTADLSFGIYFLHGYVLHIFIRRLNSYLLPLGIDQHPFFAYVLYGLVGLFGSVFIIQLIRKVFRDNSRYVVGC